MTKFVSLMLVIVPPLSSELTQFREHCHSLRELPRKGCTQVALCGAVHMRWRLSLLHCCVLNRKRSPRRMV